MRTTKFLSALLALSMGVCSAAWAQQKAPAVDPQQAAAQWADKPLPEMKGYLREKRECEECSDGPDHPLDVAAGDRAVYNRAYAPGEYGKLYGTHYHKPEKDIPLGRIRPGV